MSTWLTIYNNSSFFAAKQKPPEAETLTHRSLGVNEHAHPPAAAAVHRLNK